MEKDNRKQIENLFAKIKHELKIESSPESNNDQTDDNQINDDQTNNDHKKEAVKKNSHPIEELEKRTYELLNEVDKLEEKRLMAVAETQNTVRRFTADAQQTKKYGGERLATEIITPIDTFRKVLQTSPDDPQIKNYLIGFEMIINQMDQALSSAGIEMIQTKVGDDFSHEIHNAIEQVETDVVAPGKICAVISSGYKLHDRVIKHAVVKVAK